VRLNQVTVGATDYARSVAYYKALGLRQIVDSPPHYARFELPDGEATFSIHLVDRPPTDDFPLVYFETHDLDAEVSRLKAVGVAFEHDPKDQRWAWREAYLRDPAGNRICLYQAGVNRRYPPWRIDIKD
jgi:catechol 2,3-dioxygenase-like lactoylglutathione lyase family enzyme